MPTTNTERQKLIKKIRREIRWGIPLVAAGMVIFAAAALFIEAALVARVGAGLLSLTMGAAIYDYARQYNASADRLLRHAEKPLMWPWLPLVGGFALMNSTMETGTLVIMGVVLVVSYQEMATRRDLARALRQNALETTGAQA